MYKNSTKKLGQHFLHDESLLKEICTLGSIKAEDRILEIGAGEGTLTKNLLESKAKVTTVEIDNRLIPKLKKLRTEWPNLEIIHGDATKLNFKKFTHPTKIISNLPYQIGTKIIAETCNYPEIFNLMIVMLQLEVANRIVAKAGGKEYGSLTLWVQHRFETKLLKIVPPEMFSPPPKVKSAIVSLISRKFPIVDLQHYEEQYFKLIKTSFIHRRKTLANNLKNSNVSFIKNINIEKLLESSGISKNLRAETMTAKDFATLFEEIRKESDEL
ncbi:MAG: 16S rRNA (adenine(1518)-N(6)/adenine(1519)-N(6))-dimethyltransferase RsmA [Nitrospinota bacterium]|nr:16S rRNA (adenine(1518)-N(6)/adenine(1519)-N(6))-dimethyltransferase RsmA [Nitrospinota bacterium]